MKINVTQTEKIRAEIEKVEGRSMARLMYAHKIEDDLERIEKKLSMLLLKKNWEGISFLVDQNPQSFGGGLPGAQYSTQYTITRGKSGWFITSIKRVACMGTTKHVTPLNLNEKSEEIISFITNPLRW
jgi:hypothetical protein